MSNFWKNFTYCVKVDFCDSKTGKTETKYVAEVDNAHKECKWKSAEELQGKTDDILVFSLTRAVDLMNALTCNGYIASIQPMFKDDKTNQSKSEEK